MPNAPQSLAAQAAEWMVKLTSDDPQERARSLAGFSQWKAADAEHARAAARIEAFVDQVQGLRQTSSGNTRPARAALDAAYAGQQARRRSTARRVGGLLVLALALALPATFFVSGGAPADLLADVRSREGDWVSRTLPDGSRITLSGSTAIDLRFDDRHRVVKLLHGDIRVEVAHDATRPFDVETPLARIRALGTRFAVSHEGTKSSVEMFESRVSVQPLDGHGAVTVLRAGERLQFTRQGSGAVQPLDAARVEDGWRNHRLVLNDRPLPEVLEQLARHRPGGIRYDAQALQSLRVSAVLPLDQPDQALQLLMTSFPELRLRSLAGRWVWVDLPAVQAGK